MGFTKSGSRLNDEPWKPKVFGRSDEIIEDFVLQRLDNFDPQNNATFEMVCMKNMCFFNWKIINDVEYPLLALLALF